MNLKDENAAFERYLDGVIKYGLRHANMKTEHFKALMKRVKEMEKKIIDQDIEIKLLEYKNGKLMEKLKYCRCSK